MSAPGPDRVDVDVLADSRVGLERRYPIGRFGRLAGLLTSADGGVVASFAFGRLDDGLASCALDVSAAVSLTCQRCLEPFEVALHASTKLAFVARDEDASIVPEGYEAVPAGEGRVDLAELVEDELLLSLPVVARHGAGTRCAGTAPQAGGEERAAPAAGTHRPFARLQDLLKH
jgi:uncharacterized protein